MKRTKNRLKIRLIRIRRSYTVAEIAAVLKVHRQTVRAWHKAGMKPIEETDRPLLFLGNEVRQFLTRRRDSKRRQLADDEFYCTRCHEARKSCPSDLKIIDTDRLLGGGRKSIQIRGRCGVCRAIVCRFSSFPNPVYDLFETMIARAKKGLSGNERVLSNTHLDKGHNHENEC